MTPRRIALHAAATAGEAYALGARARGVTCVACGPVEAIVGRWGAGTGVRAALRHDRIVRQALEICASVVPFRLGVELTSEAEVHGLLEANLETLTHHLAMLRGRVEMGLKARWAREPGDPAGLSPLLEHLRSLAPRSEDRRERLGRTSAGLLFEGSYLVPRRAVDPFWSAVEELRRTSPELRLLGSGPWAAYSFCDFALQPSPAELSTTLRAPGGDRCIPFERSKRSSTAP
jgi:hypothetical protein